MSDNKLYYYQCHFCGKEGCATKELKYVCDYCLQNGHKDSVSCEKCKKQFFKEDGE